MPNLPDEPPGPATRNQHIDDTIVALGKVCTALVNTTTHLIGARTADDPGHLQEATRLADNAVCLAANAAAQVRALLDAVRRDYLAAK